MSYLFKVPFEQVAHLSCRVSPADWREKTEAWLKSRGLFCLDVLSGNQHWNFCQPPDGILVIASGKRVGDGGQHCIVVRIRSDATSLRFEDVYCPAGTLQEVESVAFFPKLFL